MPQGALVIIACCRRQHGGRATDLYPDPDSVILREALAEHGLFAELKSWDDPDVDWSRSDAVLVRSTWDSVDRPEQYLRWVQRVGSASPLINPPDALAWNLNKAYLRELEGQGVPVVPTQWLRSRRGWDPPVGVYVIKPAVSAGGRDTVLYGPGQQGEARTHVDRLVALGQVVMVQPYLRSAEEPGELSMTFIGGAFSHAVRKGPILEVGRGVEPQPWERMTSLGLAEPSASELDVARLALKAIGARLPSPLAYARVDVLADAEGSPTVLEVELIDPNLSLTLFPAAAQQLAATVARTVERDRQPR